MVMLARTFNRLTGGKVLVIGDLLLDTYTIGKARRISPEAPVPVLHVQSEDHRPGGAGNVALNLVSMGLEVSMVGRIGPDNAGDLLQEAMQREGIDVSGIFTQVQYPTPVKNRVIADNQQIVRIDQEEISPIPEMLEQEIIESLPNLLEGVDVVAISDYGKGFLSTTLLSKLIEVAKERKISTVVDPKGVDFTKYAGVDLIKPNESEAYAAVNMPREAPIEHVAKAILESVRSQALMITRSSEGISLFYLDGTHESYPVKVREVKDVTGAGDTVLAVVASAMAGGLSYGEAAELSNVAAGIAIEKVGCARVSVSDLARRLLSGEVQGKVYDKEHLFVLQQALKGQTYALLKLSSREGITPEVFNAIQEMGSGSDSELVVHIVDKDPPESFVEMLASMHNIHSIILDETCIEQLCALVSPKEIFTVEYDAVSSKTD